MVVAVASCTPTADRSATTTAVSAVTTSVSVPSSTTLPPPSTTTTTREPEGFGGEVTIGVEMAPETLNPFAPGGFGVRLPGNAIWAMVYDIDPVTWDRVPDAVEALPSQSDGITLNDDGTMTVRYDIVVEAAWSDGVPITGDDIVFTAEVMRDMSLAGQGLIDDVMGTVVNTDSEGKAAFITFEKPNLAFEDALWIILPSHHLKGVDLVKGTDGSDWPSGGPFVVDEWAPSQSIRFVRNPAYWKVDGVGKTLPYLDALTVLGTTEPGLESDEPVSPIGAFVQREVDIAEGVWSGDDIERLEGLRAEGVDVQHVPVPVVEQLTFNFSDLRFDVNSDSANEFIDFRRALASAIDRPQLLAETGVPWIPETPGMLIPRGTSAWSVYGAGVARIPELPDGATSILATTCNADERFRIKDALKPAFTTAGVTDEPVCIDSSVFFGETIVEGSFDIGMWAWVSDGGYANQLRLLEVFDPRSSPPEDGFFNGGNYGGWGDGGSANDNTSRFSDLVDEANVTVDGTRFDEIVVEAESILATELPVIPLFLRGIAAGIWSDAVSGVVNNGSQSTLTWNVETWQRPGK
jgi:ABC-type transport system substrate-binding protein